MSCALKKKPKVSISRSNQRFRLEKGNVVSYEKVNNASLIFNFYAELDSITDMHIYWSLGVLCIICGSIQSQIESYYLKAHDCKWKIAIQTIYTV